MIPKAQQDDLRNKAKTLSKALEQGYMELAKILYEVFSTPIDNDPKNPPMYMAWGYTSFTQYADEELGLDRRKAERLRAIWYRLSVELCDLDDITRARIINLGWTKVRELIRVLTLRNAQEWVEKAEGCSQQELQNAVRVYIEKRESLKAQRFAESQARQEQVIAAIAKDPEPGLESAVPAPVTASAPPPEEDEPPVIVEPMRAKQFAFYHDQFEVVDAALKRASQLTNSQKPSYLLTMICTDFLATNDFSSIGSEQFMKFLVKYENLMNVDMIVRDRNTGKILYGLQTLERMASEEE